MNASRVACACAALLLFPVAAARAWPLLPQGLEVRLTGFVQPELQAIKNDPVAGKDQIGFSLFRARALALADWTTSKVSFGARLEIEGTPQFSLYDAYLDARAPLAGGGLLRVVFGQHKAPFSRQVLVWDPDLQLIGPGKGSTGQALTKAWLTELVPSHQLGLSVSLHVPYVPWVQLWLGVYNGKGRNVLENVDTNFMYVGRLAIRPIGPLAPMVESAHGPNQLSLAANVAYNVIDQGDYDQKQVLFGADAFIAMYGFSAYAEFVWGSTKNTAHAGKMLPVQDQFNSLGYNAQAGYLLPIPGYLYRRFEIVGRFQGIIRNDGIPLARLGDPNQTVYDVVAGINYYQFGHSLKIMLNYNHYIIPEDPGRLAGKSASWDAVYLVANYKLE